jgi:hypothetical protein
LYYKQPLIACPENPAEVIAELRKENAELKADLKAKNEQQLNSRVELLVRKEQT